MTSETAASLTLPAAVARAVETFVQQLEQRLEQRLAGLVIYGSAVQGGWLEQRSDVNLLVVVDELTAADLEFIAQSLPRRSRLAPVVMSPGELAATAERLPLALCDIRDYGRLLSGQDPLQGLDLPEAALARQVTWELTDKLHVLRAGYLTACGDRRAVEVLAVATFGSLLPLLRGLLRLHELPTSGDPVRTFGDAARKFDLDLRLLQLLYSLRYQDAKLEADRAGTLVDRLAELLTQAAEAAAAVPIPEPVKVDTSTMPSVPPEPAAEPAAMDPAADEARPEAEAAPPDEAETDEPAAPDELGLEPAVAEAELSEAADETADDQP